MRSIHFDAQGFSRTYWDFFSAFGLFFSVFLLFAALLAWQLGGLPAETFARMRPTAWALAICFAAVTALSWRYAFTTPIVFSTIITMCLIAADRKSTRLNSSHVAISYAVFCLKKKKNTSMTKHLRALRYLSCSLFVSI